MSNDIDIVLANEAACRAIYGADNGFAFALNNAVIASHDLAALAQLPEGFIPVTERQPAHDKPVLAIRRAAYTGARFEVMTARYMAEYRPHSPWRDIGSDAVSDSGGDILGWREVANWLNAA